MRLGVAAAKLQKLVGPHWRILKALERSLRLALRRWEPVKNFTQQQDPDRGSDREDGAGPAGRQWWGGDRGFRDVWGGGSAGLPDGLIGEGWGEADSGMAFWFLYLSAGVGGAHQALGPQEELDSE